jgi:hypothetical protein
MNQIWHRFDDGGTPIEPRPEQLGMFIGPAVRSNVERCIGMIVQDVV